MILVFINGFHDIAQINVHSFLLQIAKAALLSFLEATSSLLVSGRGRDGNALTTELSGPMFDKVLLDVA